MRADIERSKWGAARLLLSVGTTNALRMCGKTADVVKWATKTTERCFLKILWLNSGYCTRYLQTPPPPHYNITATRWGAVVPRWATTICVLLLLLYWLLRLLRTKRSIATLCDEVMARMRSRFKGLKKNDVKRNTYTYNKKANAHCN